MGRKKLKRIRRDWPSVIEDYHKSGLTKKGYCIEHGIKRELFMRWYKRYEDDTLTKPRRKRLSVKDFVQLDVPVKATPIMEINFPDGISISTYTNCDPELLHSVISKLKELV